MLCTAKKAVKIAIKELKAIDKHHEAKNITTLQHDMQSRKVLNKLVKKVKK